MIEQIPSTHEKNKIIKKENIIFNNLEIKNLSFSYLGSNKKTLNNINLKISNNTSVGIIGKTGAGKSTLIKLILGLLHSSKGSVLVNDKEIKKILIIGIKILVTCHNQYFL